MPSPATGKKSTFDTSIRAWLSAMEKARKIKPGSRLVFINKRTGTAVSHAPPTDNTE